MSSPRRVRTIATPETIAPAMAITAQSKVMTDSTEPPLSGHEKTPQEHLQGLALVAAEGADPSTPEGPGFTDPVQRRLLTAKLEWGMLVQAGAADPGCS